MVGMSPKWCRNKWQDYQLSMTIELSIVLIAPFFDFQHGPVEKGSFLSTYQEGSLTSNVV